MTNEDIRSEGERALVRYSDNERTIECVIARLVTLRDAVSRLATAKDVTGGTDECGAVAEILGGRDLRQDVDDLEAALKRRHGLAEQLRAHGHGHMLRCCR